MSDRTVLLIESVDDDATAMADLFASVGFEVVRAGDGREGVDMARTHGPALIVLAVELPGLSGYIACKNIRRDKDLATIPLIITSSTATNETFEQHKSLRTRADAYLHKPLDGPLLLDTASQFVAIVAVGDVDEDEDDDDDDLFLDPDDGGIDLEDVSVDMDAIGGDDLVDMMDLDLSDELDMDALDDSMAGVLDDLDLGGEELDLDIDASLDSIADLDSPPVVSSATPSRPEIAVGLQNSERAATQISVSIPPPPRAATAVSIEAPPPESTDESDGEEEVVQELLAQIEARDARITLLEVDLEKALESSGSDDAKKLQDEVDTLRDIEVTQQETIERLQVEKEELEAQLESSAASAEDASTLAEAAEAAAKRADEAEAALGALRDEMKELLGGIHELLAAKIGELG